MGQKFNPLSGQFDLVVDQADEVKYDNTSSGLTATEVQAAIDEIDGIIDALPDPITYAGTWSAASNSPTLANTDTGVTGFLYRVIAAGTVDFGAGNISFDIGDSVVNNGTVWEKWDHSDQVLSVNSQTGAVVLDTDNINEGATNLYYTDSRAQGAIIGGASSIVTANLTSNRALASDGSGKVSASSVTATELGELSGVTSNVQTQLNGKEPTITVLPVAKGGTNSSTALNNNRIMRTDSGAIIEAPAITANRALASDASGIPTHTAVTDTELGHLSGVTSAIQTQLDNKAEITYVDAQDAEYGNRVLRNYLASLYSGASIAGINTYNDGASVVPVDGTGGTATGLTTALNTSTPLRRASCQRFSKDAANRQGMGWSVDFDVDPADYEGSKSLFSKLLFKTSANYAAGDVRVFAYDKDNGQLLNVLSLSGDGSLLASPEASAFSGSFSTASTSNSYRLIFHITSTNALAYDIDLIDLSASPDVVQPGAIITEWTSWTPTGSWSTNTTYTGHKRRVGDQAEYQINIALAGAPTAAALTINLPSGEVIDTSKLASTTAQLGVLPGATVSAIDSGSNGYAGLVAYKDTTSVNIMRSLALENGSSGPIVTGNFVNATAPFTFGSGDAVVINFSVPIVGWEASAALSTNELLLKNLKTYMQRNAAVSIANNTATTVVFDTEVNDEFSAYNTSTGVFTAPRSDWYLSIGQVKYQSYSAGAIAQVFLRKNGATDIMQYDIATPTTAAAWTLPVNKLVYLNQGETLQVVTFQNSGSSRALSVGESQTFWSIVQQPDLATFGTYGQFQVIPATSATKTPSASGHFHALTGNSINLPVGTWKLKSLGSFLNGGVSPSYTILRMGWYAANGADSAAQPALLSTIPGLTVLSAYAVAVDQYYEETSAIANRVNDGYDLIVQCTQPCTVYLVTNTSQSTSANARVTVYGTAERLQ